MQKFLNNYAFIDSQNLNLSVRDQCWKLDYKKFRIYLKDKFNVEKAFLFIGYIPKNKKIYDNLHRSGFEIIFKPISKQNGKIKGNVDAELVLHCMINYNNFNKAVIITGDGDFHCLIEYLEKKNKLSKLIVPNKYKYSALLKRFLNKTTSLNNLKPKLILKERHLLKDGTLSAASHGDQRININSTYNNLSKDLRKI